MDLVVAESMARGVMEDLGLGHWRFKWDRARTRLGLCDPNTRTLSFPSPAWSVLNEDQFINTLWHECAHAIVGTSHGHDWTWRRMHLMLGGNGKTGSDMPLEARAAGAVYAIFCNEDNALIAYAYRRNFKVHNKRCIQHNSTVRLVPIN